MKRKKAFASHSEIIDAFGYANFQKALGLKTIGHARIMRLRDSIPDKYWFALPKVAEKYGVEGVTPEVLWALKQEKSA